MSDVSGFRRKMAAGSSSDFVVGALDKLFQAQTVETAWAVLTTTMERFDFDRLFYGFTRYHTAHGLGSPEDMLVLSNHAEAYLDGYIGKEMYLCAPMMEWARQNVGAMSWAYIADSKLGLDERQKEVIAFNNEHGVTAGYTISFRDAVTRNKGAIGLCARRGLDQCDVEQIWARYCNEINVLNQAAHLKFASLPLPNLNKRLSLRQRQVLEWVGDGKTTADIATIMGLTVATVEKHLKKARDALNVETTAQAVVKASLHNQIFLVDTEMAHADPR